MTLCGSSKLQEDVVLEPVKRSLKEELMTYQVGQKVTCFVSKVRLEACNGTEEFETFVIKFDSLSNECVCVCVCVCLYSTTQRRSV